MSGPKTSEYTVTAGVRRILLEQAKLEQQRQIEKQRLAERKKRKLAELKEIKSLRAQISALPNTLEETCNIARMQRDMYGDDSQFLYKVELLKKDIAAEVEKNLNRDLTLERLLEIKKHLLTAKESYALRISNLKKEGTKIHKELSDNLEKDIENGFNINIPKYEDDIVERVQENQIDFSFELVKIKDMLLALSENCSQELKAKASNAIKCLEEIHDYAFFQNFKNITISQIKKEYENEQLQLQQRLIDEQLYQKEQAYIADTVDEVMKEMGYDLIGNREVTKKSGKRFRDELYTFSEGTAVNIRYDNQGKITMELGGIDSTDRLPSSSEASRLKDEMVVFCDKFTELEKRLAAKGIVCKNRVSHLPPKAEYAQIINTSDYKVNARGEMSKRKVKTKKDSNKKIHNQ